MAEARSAEPTEEQISSLCEIAGFSRTEAISRLKANGLDADRAVDEWLNNPDSSKYYWDESAWSADREGDANTAGIGFHVQGPDVTASYHNSAAPTRPPSRTNNRSPLGRLVDLTAFQAAGISPASCEHQALTRPRIGAPATAAEADADLQRAMAISRAEAGLPPQETGIIDSGGNDVTAKSFGPATRAEYEKDQWAMVPIKADTAPTATELTPSARKRTPPAPAFLRTTKDHRLGAIVTILHAIPKVRNLLLSCGPVSRTYGHNSEWWTGQTILSPELLEMLSRDEWATTAKPDFYEELHRLIAFLDNTDRAYGSIDNLAQTNVIDPSHFWSGPDFEDQFFSFLKGQYDEDARLDSKLFISTAKTARVILDKTPQGGAQGMADGVVDGDGAQVVDDADMADSDSSSDNSQEFPFLDITLEAGQNAWVKSLYDALDGVFWNQALTDKMNQFKLDDSCRFAYLTDVSQVFTIRINGEGLCQPCDIPAVLFMDRYMESRKDTAMICQDYIHRMRSVLYKGPDRRCPNLSRCEDNIQYCRGKPRCRELGWWDGKPHLALDCWHKFIKACEAALKKQRKAAQKRHTVQRIQRGDVPTIHEIAIIRLGRSPYELTEEEETWKKNVENDIEIAKRSMNEIDDVLDRKSPMVQETPQRNRITYQSCHRYGRESSEGSRSSGYSVQVVDMPGGRRPLARVCRSVYLSQRPKHLQTPLLGSHPQISPQRSCNNQGNHLCLHPAGASSDRTGGRAGAPRPMVETRLFSTGDQPPIHRGMTLFRTGTFCNTDNQLQKTDLDTVTMLAGTESKNPILIYAAEETLDATPTELSDALRVRGRVFLSSQVSWRFLSNHCCCYRCLFVPTTAHSRTNLRGSKPRQSNRLRTRLSRTRRRPHWATALCP
jgi:hypothetical protein